jgi:hypothetical protein
MKVYEKSVYSQNGEDGIIEHIFNVIGTTNKIAVEFGVSATGNGSQNNTRNLADKGWQLFWFDLLDIEETLPNCFFKKIKLTSQNIVEEFEKAGIPKEFDLLSIDVDGNDYHLRKEVNYYAPRVCVMEYNGTKLKDEEYVMPYYENYKWGGKNDHRFGASLLSITKLLDNLGYDLIYVENNGVNAFFVRKDVNKFEKTTVNDSWKPVRWMKKITK